jgi:hypothetical protein
MKLLLVVFFVAMLGQCLIASGKDKKKDDDD